VVQKRANALQKAVACDKIMPSTIIHLGAIVGVADLVDVVEESDDPWFCGTLRVRVLDNAQAFDEPIPYRGALKLFSVPRSVVQLQTRSV
jgi:hypothetical protein